MYSPKTIALLALTGLVLGCTTNLYAQKKNSKNVIAPYEKYIDDNADQHWQAFRVFLLSLLMHPKCSARLFGLNKK